MRFSRILATGALAALAGTMVFAEAHNTPEAMAITARKSHMQLNQFNAGILFSMAKESMAFDASAAQSAADNLVALTALSQRAYWLPGTTNDDSDKTRALPAIWAEGSDVGAKSKAFTEAALAMQAAAGTLEGVQANIGAVGGTCTACHKAFRAPDS